MRLCVGRMVAAGRHVLSLSAVQEQMRVSSRGLGLSSKALVQESASPVLDTGRLVRPRRYSCTAVTAVTKQPAWLIMIGSGPAEAFPQL